MEEACCWRCGRVPARALALVLCLAGALLAQRLNPPSAPSPFLPTSPTHAASPPAPDTTVHLPGNETILPTAIAPPAPDILVAGHDLDVGKFYYNRGDYAGALARFDDAIYNDPTSAEAYCRAGDTEAKLKHVQPARGDWQHCLKTAESGHWADHARKALAKHPSPAQL